MTWINFEIVSRRQHNFLSLFIASLLDGDALPHFGPFPLTAAHLYVTFFFFAETLVHYFDSDGGVMI